MRMELEQRIDELSDILHRRVIESHHGVVWLSLDGVAPERLAESELRQALLARSPVPVPLRHSRIDERLWPSWYRLDVSRASDSAILRLSLTLGLLELDPKTLREGRGREVAGWLLLDPDTDVSRAAAQAGRQMIQRRLGGDLLLRTHDPAVLWWLWRFIEGSQRAALLGSVQQWWLLNPAGELECLAHGASAQHDGLALSEPQWQEVMGIGALNHALREFPASVNDPHVFDILREALGRARSHGLTDPSDLALFGCHAAQVHPRFDRHPLLAERLRNRQPDDFYSALVAELDEAAWRQIRQDCDQHDASA
jgi:hypothetical protein